MPWGWRWRGSTLPGGRRTSSTRTNLLSRASLWVSPATRIGSSGSSCGDESAIRATTTPARIPAATIAFFLTSSSPSVGGRFVEQPEHEVEVGVPSAQDDADAPAFDRNAAAEGGGEAERARGLDDELHALPQEAHRVDEVLVRDGGHVVHVLADEREGERSERSGPRAVRDRGGV